MKTLQEYLLGVRKETKLKIRFAMTLTDEMLDKIETALKKYDLISISAPKKTIFQTRAIGWEDPINSEVTIIEVSLGLPVSEYVLRIEVARSIKVSEVKLAITNDCDLDQTEFKKASDLALPKVEVETYVGIQTQIGPDVITKVKPEDFYGDEYNQNMIKTLGDARKEIKNNINKTSK